MGNWALPGCPGGQVPALAALLTPTPSLSLRHQLLSQRSLRGPRPPGPGPGLAALVLSKAWPVLNTPHSTQKLFRPSLSEHTPQVPPLALRALRHPSPLPPLLPAMPLSHHSPPGGPRSVSQPRGPCNLPCCPPLCWRFERPPAQEGSPLLCSLVYLPLPGVNAGSVYRPHGA